MNVLFSLPLGLASLLASLYLLAVHPDAPGRRVARAATIDGPRCVVCNKAAATSQVYQHDFDERTPGGQFGASHDFCIEHAGHESLTTFTWPNLDKYLFSGCAIALYLMAFGASIAGILGVFREGEGGAAFAAPVFLFLGWGSNNLMTMF